jgi:hypothetical protein
MRVLVGCEYSQIVTRAFRDKGHEAFSCDIEPTEGNPAWHIQGDVLQVINDQWDLAVFHPPCTFLTNAANRWLYEKCATTTPEERHTEREAAIDLFLALKNAPIKRIAIENPMPHPYVVERVGVWQQLVRPCEHGDSEQKGICLWLKNLPPLFATMIETKRTQGIWKMGSNKDRRKERSRFYPGVAKAMADQWSIT